MFASKCQKSSQKNLVIFSSLVTVYKNKCWNKRYTSSCNDGIGKFNWKLNWQSIVNNHVNCEHTAKEVNGNRLDDEWAMSIEISDIGGGGQAK